MKSNHMYIVITSKFARSRKNIVARKSDDTANIVSYRRGIG